MVGEKRSTVLFLKNLPRTLAIHCEKLMTNPKFRSHIRDQVDQIKNESPTSRYGIISSYDPFTNTATVILSAPDSDQVEKIERSVMCPVYPGIQMVSPQPGQGCWVIWAGGKQETRPMISHYFNWNFQKQYDRQYRSVHTVPQYMLSM